MEISREGVQQTLFINIEFTFGLESPSEEWFQEVDPWAGRYETQAYTSLVAGWYDSGEHSLLLGFWFLAGA